MIKRRKTGQVKIGSVKVGGGAGVSIQSMTKVATSNVKAVISQIKALEKCGCDIVRVAIKNLDDAAAVRQIKRKTGIPIVCDIHFDYRLALKAIESGADKIRLNPGNIQKYEEVAQIVRAAKKAGIPIRVGVNSGSVKGSLVDSALNYVKMIEGMGFRDIIISLKASDVLSTVDAYRKIASLCNYPLHLGITASGPYTEGVIKSSIGIGALLLDGIGDTIRVSLTADPVEEVYAGARILAALGLGKAGTEIISCPTCGRCQIDLVKIVNELEKKLSAIRYPLNAKSPFKIAVMGCEVNGPGEAGAAGIGIAFGKGSGILFKDGKILKKVKVKDAVKEIVILVREFASSRVREPANQRTREL